MYSFWKYFGVNVFFFFFQGKSFNNLCSIFSIAILSLFIVISYKWMEKIIMRRSSIFDSSSTLKLSIKSFIDEIVPYAKSYRKVNYTYSMKFSVLLKFDHWIKNVRCWFLVFYLLTYLDCSKYLFHCLL